MRSESSSPHSYKRMIFLSWGTPLSARGYFGKIASDKQGRVPLQEGSRRNAWLPVLLLLVQLTQKDRNTRHWVSPQQNAEKVPGWCLVPFCLNFKLQNFLRGDAVGGAWPVPGSRFASVKQQNCLFA